MPENFNHKTVSFEFSFFWKFNYTVSQVNLLIVSKIPIAKISEVHNVI